MDLSEKEGSAAQPNFLSKLNMDMCSRGGRELEVHVQSSFFPKKYVFDIPEQFFWFKLHINFSITHQPKPYQKISIFLLIITLSEIDFAFSNFQCQNLQTTVGGWGVRTKSKHFASIPSPFTWPLKLLQSLISL